MATLRELLVKIAFQVDNGGMKKLEQTTSQTLKRIEGMFGISEKKALQTKKQTDEQKKKSDFNYTQWWASQLHKQEKLAEKKAELEKKLAEKTLQAKIKSSEIANKIEESNLKYKMRLIANSRRLEEQALKQATKIAEQEANKQKQAREKNQTVGSGITGNLTGGLLAGIGAFGAGAIVAGGAIIRLNDAMNTSIARIGVLSGDMGTAKDRFKEIIQVSNQTGQSVDSLSSLYGKITMNAGEFGASNADQIKALSTVAKLAKIGGTSTVAQQGGLIQLGQALGSATVQADEYRSIVEGLPALNKAIAKTMGKTGPQLQAFIKNTRTTGGITGKELFEAIIKATEETEKGFAKLPLTFQRVMNQGVNTFTELGMAMEDKLAPVNTFIEGLQERIVRLKDYIIANKEPIGKAIEKLFEGFNNFLNLMEGAIPLVAPIFNFLVDHFDDITALVAGLLAGLTVLNAFFLYTLIPTLFAVGTAFLVAFPEIRILAIIATVTAVVVGLIVKFDLLNKAIKGVGDAWNAISAKFSEAGVSFSGALERASRGEIRGGGREQRRLQSEAQRQGWGGGKQFVSSTTNVGGSTLNFTSPVSQSQAEKIGMGLMGGITRGLVALETMA